MLYNPTWSDILARPVRQNVNVRSKNMDEEHDFDPYEGEEDLDYSGAEAREESYDYHRNQQ